MDEGFDVTKRYLQLPYHPLTHTAARALTHTFILCLAYKTRRLQTTLQTDV